MLFRVEKEDVIEGMQKAASIIPAKTGTAYLRSIWLKAEGTQVSVLATDANLEFCGSYKADVEGTGLVGVQGRVLVDLIRKLPQGTITFRLDKESGNLLIEQGRRKYKLPAHDASWFQNFSDFPEEGTIVWSGSYIQELIEKVMFCIGDEDAMEAIACLYMKPVEDNCIEVCGLNGHQFAMQKFKNEDLSNLMPPEGILIQKKYLSELKKWLSDKETELNIAEKRLYFRTSDKTERFSLPLSFYQYPDYRNFLSKLDTEGVSRLQVSRRELLESLDRIAIFNTETNRGTIFDLTHGTEMTLSSGQDTGSAAETMEITYEGSIKKISFPTRNFIEIINHYQSETMTVILTGTEGPCGLTGENDADYTVIIMPMKMVDNTYYSEEEA